jgi:hypothetical protein
LISEGFTRRYQHFGRAGVRNLEQTSEIFCEGSKVSPRGNVLLRAREYSFWHGLLETIKEPGVKQFADRLGGLDELYSNPSVGITPAHFTFYLGWNIGAREVHSHLKFFSDTQADGGGEGHAALADVDGSRRKL